MKTGGEFLTTVAGSQEIFSREHFSEEQRDFLSQSGVDAEPVPKSR
jgi:hypothetical protein